MAKKNAKQNAIVAAAASEILDMNAFMAGIAESATEIQAEASVLEQVEAELAAAEFEPEEGHPANVDAAPATDDAGQEAELEPVDHVPGDLKVLKGNFTPDEKLAMKTEIVDAFTTRKDFEKAQPGLSSKMIPNLEAEEKKMATIGAAGLFLAMDIDPSFINREVSTGSRFNVYAFQKVNDLIVALDGGFMQNAINRAIVASLFNFRDAGIPFTGTAALCAVSDKIKADRAIAKHLVRHTVSANTASTQKSSTMTALKTLGIVTNSGPRGQEVWALTDTPQTRRLEEVVRGKIAA